MNMAFYIGRSGIMAHSNDLNISAQNVTNANTNGYKATNGVFRELVYNTLDQNFNKALADEKKILNGHGTKVQADALQFSQGDLQMTDFDLDFALEGDGLFAVERNGQIQYTRDGAFDVSIENGGNYLVTTDGGYVLDQNGNRILIPKDENNKLDIEGLTAKIGVFSFTNPYGLQRIDGQRFLPSETSGEPQNAATDTYKLVQGAIERSNTNLAKEMSDVIVTQKAYAFSAKVVQTADEIEDIVNNLRG